MSDVQMVWKRWGQWSAHLFDGDRQVCTTRHPYVGVRRDAGKATPGLLIAPLSTNGVPYGNVCGICLRIFHRNRESKA